MSLVHDVKSAQAVLLIKCGAYVSEQRESSMDQIAATMLRAFKKEVEEFPREGVRFDPKLLLQRKNFVVVQGGSAMHDGLSLWRR
jgi:hypothetical protein